MERTAIPMDPYGAAMAEKGTEQEPLLDKTNKMSHNHDPIPASKSAVFAPFTHRFPHRIFTTVFSFWLAALRISGVSLASQDHWSLHEQLPAMNVWVMWG